MKNFRDLLTESLLQELTKYVETDEWEEEYMLKALERSSCWDYFEFKHLYTGCILPKMSKEERVENHLFNLVFHEGVKEEDLVEYLERE